MTTDKTYALSIPTYFITDSNATTETCCGEGVQFKVTANTPIHIGIDGEINSTMYISVEKLAHLIKEYYNTIGASKIPL